MPVASDARKKNYSLGAWSLAWPSLFGCLLLACLLVFKVLSLFCHRIPIDPAQLFAAHMAQHPSFLLLQWTSVWA